MADRPINREAWAVLVQRLIEEEAGGNKSAFGRMVDVQYQTVRRWINAENDVSEESVRSVARALNLRPMDLLVQVGYYDHGDIGAEPADTRVDSDQEAARLIDEATLTPAIRREMRRWLADRQAEDARRRLADLRLMVDREKRRIA